MFTYITANTNKIASARERLSKAGIEFTHQKLDIVEIQSADPAEIVLAKANSAYDTLGSPVVVNDNSWSIPALNGFPGSYMHFMEEWFTEDDFLNLMRSKKDRTVHLTTRLVYKDEKVSKLFESTRTGEFLRDPRGEGKYSLDRIVTFRPDKKSLAECIDNAIERMGPGPSVWDGFVEWYKTSI